MGPNKKVVETHKSKHRFRCNKIRQQSNSPFPSTSRVTNLLRYNNRVHHRHPYSLRSVSLKSVLCRWWQMNPSAPMWKSGHIYTPLALWIAVGSSYTTHHMHQRTCQELCTTDVQTKSKQNLCLKNIWGKSSELGPLGCRKMFVLSGHVLLSLWTSRSSRRATCVKNYC